MSIHPQVIEKDGRREFVVLPYEEFLQIKESLEDYEDLKDLRKAKSQEQNSPTLAWSEIKETLLSDAAE